MIGIIGIFVITSSACHSKVCVDEFVRTSTSANTSHGEMARPVCDWIPHQWVEIFNYTSNYELHQCIYCERKRIKKEVWEYVK